MDPTNPELFQEFGDDLRSARDDAIKTYENLRKKGKLDDAQWDMLTRQTHPSDLLESVANAPYAKAEETKLLKLVKSSIDVVVRFDTELSTLVAGTSQVSLGIPSCAWAGLSFIVHVANDIFKTPELIVEVVAKVFVLMPRIDLYWELFHDERNALDVRPLLVDIYKTILLLNTQAISWYASSKFEKFKRTLVADPRGHFQKLLVKMTEASEEMRKRAEALNLKAQESRQKELLEEFRKRDEDQKRRIEELIDLIVQKHQGELAQQARRIQDMKDQTSKQKSIMSQQENLESYMKFADLRESLWNILHGAPYTILHEGFVDLGSPSGGRAENSGKNWRTGHYSSTYPVHDGLAEISLVVDWKPHNGPEKPSLHWMINVPDSLYYPGRHVGQFELGFKSAANFGGNYKLFQSRLRIMWESPIFSPFQNEDGRLSSVGPLEETSTPLILTKTLQSMAHLLVFGPFATKPTAPFAFHSMGPQENRYFLQKDADQCMRATAFFANAFTRDPPDPDDFGDFGLLPQCRESSVKAIQELVSFYELAGKVDEKAIGDKKWQLPGAYDSANSHQDWIERDQEWATLIADLAGLKFIAKSSLKRRSVPEMIKVFEAPVAQPDGHSPIGMRLGQPVGVNPGRATGPVEGRDHGLPTDWSPLHLAVWHQDLGEVMALANRQSVSVKDNIGYTPLHLACSRSSSLLFTSRQVFDRESSGFGSTAYDNRRRSLTRSDNEDAAVQMCRVLLGCGADPNATATGKSPWTPMHCAANSPWMKVAQLLLEHGGSAFSAKFCSPYCWASDNDTPWMRGRFTIPGEPETMKELLKLHLSQEQLDAIDADHADKYMGAGNAPLDPI